MKTTIDLDEEKLLSVMKLKSFKTRKEAIDYALDVAERRAKVDLILRESPLDIKGPWIREGYDVIALRDGDRPRYGKKGGG